MNENEMVVRGSARKSHYHCIAFVAHIAMELLVLIKVIFHLHDSQMNGMFFSSLLNCLRIRLTTIDDKMKSYQQYPIAEKQKQSNEEDE